MTLIEHLLGRFVAIWCCPAKNSSRVRLFFLSSLIALCVITASIGAVPTITDGHDDFFFLENGWRVFNGLRPHLDFWSSWGPLSYLIVALGLKLGHQSANAIGYGNAIAAFCIGVWSYVIGRGRMTASPRVIVALYGALLVCAPYPLGLPPTLNSHAMAYNRLGYALTMIVVLECYTRVDIEKAKWSMLLGGISTGAATALTLFLKASYFMVALALIFSSLVLLRFDWRRLIGLVAGFTTISFLGIAYLRFDLGAMIYGLRMAAAARSLSFHPSVAFWQVSRNLLPLLGVISLAVAASFLKLKRSEWLGDIHLPVLALLIYSADTLLLLSNMQASALPLLPVFAILIANLVALSKNESGFDSPDDRLPYYACLLLFSSFLFLPQACSDSAGLTAGALRKINPSAFASTSCSVRFTEPRLSALILCDYSRDAPGGSSISGGAIYTTYVNDGTAMLRRFCGPTDKVLTMDMQNPFPYALGWQPPRGGIASTSFNYTFSAKFGPSFDGYFGDATVVMLPKHPAQAPQLIDGFYTLYLPALKHRFRLAAESEWFWLYKRK